MKLTKKIFSVFFIRFQNKEEESNNFVGFGRKVSVKEEVGVD
jgi:hypothetical protein